MHNDTTWIEALYWHKKSGYDSLELLYLPIGLEFYKLDILEINNRFLRGDAEQTIKRTIYDYAWEVTRKSNS